MKHLISLSVDPHSLTDPPPVVADWGPRPLLHYLQLKSCSSHTWNSMRVVVVGLKGSGKSHLIARIREEKSVPVPPTKGLEVCVYLEGGSGGGEGGREGGKEGGKEGRREGGRESLCIILSLASLLSHSFFLPSLSHSLPSLAPFLTPSPFPSSTSSLTPSLPPPSPSLSPGVRMETSQFRYLQFSIQVGHN